VIIINLKKFLPMTESSYYILLSLMKPLHGYAIMQNVEMLSEGTVTIAPGTLYGALENLTKQKLILLLEINSDKRRKVYQITQLGMQVLHMECDRMRKLIQISDVYFSNTIGEDCLEQTDKKNYSMVQ